MRFKRFTIKNYKGIETATIDLVPGGANIFTLIGLNESGKTTLLEAISLFASSESVEHLYGGENKKDRLSSYIPKDRQANFTGRISISALVEFELDEREEVIAAFESKHNCKIDQITFKSSYTYTRIFDYKESDVSHNGNELDLTLDLKIGSARKFIRQTDKDDTWKAMAVVIREALPRIVFFPTFIFSFPNRILLNPPERGEDPVNKIYRQVVEDIGASLTNKIDVQKHVVKRIVDDVNSGSFASAFSSSARQREVSSALETMSFHVSKTVFSAWKIILGSGYVKKEIVLRPITETLDGRTNVYIQFALRERGSVYDLSERSLGFRWFFSFLLFTFYRSRANLRGSTLFLLDEPASHLHPNAQAQLLESFPQIAGRKNYIVYSTHSHYMINPRWLEQAYIVANAATEKSDEQDEFDMISENPTRITVEKYRKFVGERPDKPFYYQAVLDKLQYAPSSIEVSRKSVVVEGKGDFVILSYVKDVILDRRDEFAFVPTRGASGMDEIIGLLMGWGIEFCVCLDADREGELAKAKYRKDWGLSEDRVFSYVDIDSTLSGARLEDLLDDLDRQSISSHFDIDGPPSKDMIRNYYSEFLGSAKVVYVSDRLKGVVSAVIDRAIAAFKSD